MISQMIKALWDVTSPGHENLLMAMQAMVQGEEEEARGYIAQQLLIRKSVFAGWVNHPDRLEVLDIEIEDKKIRGTVQYRGGETEEVEVDLSRYELLEVE